LRELDEVLTTSKVHCKWSCEAG